MISGTTAEMLESVTVHPLLFLDCLTLSNALAAFTLRTGRNVVLAWANGGQLLCLF